MSNNGDILMQCCGSTIPKPVRRGDHIYYTDGRIAVRTSLNGQAVPETHFNLDDRRIWDAPVSSWQAMPEDYELATQGELLLGIVCGVAVQRKYLDIIKLLPRVYIGVCEVEGMKLRGISNGFPYKALRFKFDGGEGCVACVLREEAALSA